jgi:hypothetical protein
MKTNTTTEIDTLAFSAILNGLLASGHYTKKVEIDEDGDVSRGGYIDDDYGKNWREYSEDNPRINMRFIPLAVTHAEQLWMQMKRHLNINANE